MSCWHQQAQLHHCKTAEEGGAICCAISCGMGGSRRRVGAQEHGKVTLTCYESGACQEQTGQHRAAVPQHEPCVKQRVAMVPGHAAQADTPLPEGHSLLDLHALHGPLYGQGSGLDTGSPGWWIVGTAPRPGTVQGMQLRPLRRVLAMAAWSSQHRLQMPCRQLLCVAKHAAWEQPQIRRSLLMQAAGQSH